jgi:hypothetical protein
MIWGVAAKVQVSEMNAIWPWQRWLYLATTICGLAALASFVLDPNHVWSAKHVWSAVKTGVSIGMTVCGLVVSTPAWRLLWILPGMRRKLPLLDGRWRGIQSSNWPVIEAMKNDAKAATAGIDVDNAGTTLPGLLDTQLEVEIRTTFFGIRMELLSVITNYQNSFLKAAVLTPETEIARGRLTYIFEGRVPRPKSTDVDRFDGAAELEIYVADTGELELNGKVWTNRNWPNGLNTAGVIELKRAESWAVPSFLRFGRARRATP